MNSSGVSHHLFTCDATVIFNILVNIVISKDLIEKVLDILVEKSSLGKGLVFTNIGFNCDSFQKYELTMDVNFYRSDCLKNEFVLEKGFAVTNLTSNLVIRFRSMN